MRFLASFAVLLACAIGAAVRDDPYFQPMVTRLTTSTFPVIADWTPLGFAGPIVQVASINAGPSTSQALVMTSTQLWTMSFDVNGNLTGTTRLDATLKLTVGSGMQIASLTGANFAVASPSALMRCTLTSCTSLSASFGPVASVVQGQNGDIWVGALNGLFQVTSANKVNLQQIGGNITAVAYFAPTNQIAAGTPELLWRILPNLGWHYFRTPGIIDGAITALAFDRNGALWVANNICINLQLATLQFVRIAGLEGLPTNNTNAVLATANGVWLGAQRGGSRQDLDTFQWKYFFGSRWLPSRGTTSKYASDNFVVSLADVSWTAGGQTEERVLMATPQGFALVRYVQYTLAQKAAVYAAMVYPRHDRYGLVSGCNLKTFGNLSSYQLESDDNDGLWTSLYVAAESFRYAATKDPTAKANAWASFVGMEFLNNVTGIPGLMARSVLFASNPGNIGGTWHNSTVYPGWIWKGDTSSDEVTGHMFAYPIFYHLAAETPDEKARALRLVRNIVTYIVSNDYNLIDVTGKPTTWGKWGPTYLNDDPDWYDERGVGSMQILSYILSAYAMTGDSMFMTHFNSLVNTYGYGENIINAKITQPSDDNYSDDELTFLPYYLYAFTNPDPQLVGAQYHLSIQRTWDIIRKERSSLWNVVYGASGASDFEMDNAMWTLRTWPMSLVSWPYDNSQRLDMRPNLEASRFGTPLTLTLYPYDELGLLVWNSDPYDLSGNSGYNEQTPSAWLLPYWMARYHGFIK